MRKTLHKALAFVSGLLLAGSVAYAVSPVKVDILDLTTGLRIGGAAASGKFMRGDGTNFISSNIAAATDLAEALCTASQILKKNAGNTAWECAADAGGGTSRMAYSAASSDSMPDSVTRYLALSGSQALHAANFAPRSLPPLTNGTFGNLRCRFQATPGASETITTCLSDNSGVCTALTCTITASSVDCSDAVHTVAYTGSTNPGMMYKLVSTALATNDLIGCSVEITF